MVRTAEKKDLSCIFELEKDYIECPWSEKLLLEAYNEGSYTFFVFECDGIIAGYGGVKLMDKDAEICNIAVKEEYRGKGIAKMILAAIEEHCKKNFSKEIFLEVNEFNISAVGLYKKFLYVNSGYRKNYYKSGGAILMKKEIDF